MANQNPQNEQSMDDMLAAIAANDAAEAAAAAAAPSFPLVPYWSPAPQVQAPPDVVRTPARNECYLLTRPGPYPSELLLKLLYFSSSEADLDHWYSDWNFQAFCHRQFRITFFKRGIQLPVPSCGTPDLVRKIRDWGGAKIQEQDENSQPATEETEGTEDVEDGHRQKRQKLIHIPASAEAARMVFMTNVILKQLYICSANIAIVAADADDVVMEAEPQNRFQRSRKRYVPEEDSTMAIFDPEVVPWLQCGGGYRVGYFAAVCLEYVFPFKRLETFQQFVDAAKWLATDAAKYRENQPEQDEIPLLAIDLRLFHEDGFERAKELCLYRPHIGQHGLELGAQDHFEEWIKALKVLLTLPIRLQINLHFCHPFRDFKFVREETKALHLATNVEELEFSMEKYIWKSTPAAELHKALLKFAIFGERMEERHETRLKGMSDADLQHWLEHGTTGIRGMKVFDKRPGSSG